MPPKLKRLKREESLPERRVLQYCSGVKVAISSDEAALSNSLHIATGISGHGRAYLNSHDGLQNHRPSLVEALAEGVLAGKLERNLITVHRVRYAIRQRNPDSLTQIPRRVKMRSHAQLYGL